MIDSVSAASYDAWRTAGPPEPEHDWEDFERYIDEQPDCGWDPESEDDFYAYCEWRNEQRAEEIAERMTADRDDDDRAYWASL